MNSKSTETQNNEAPGAPRESMKTVSTEREDNDEMHDLILGQGVSDVGVGLMG